MATTVTTTTPTIPPNQTLYIQNLPENLPKPDLRRALYMLFSTYGPILDVTALKTKAMRGQAHVLFRDVQSATQALRSCHGHEFLGREMRITYSKNRSNTLAKLTGTFNQPTTTITTGEQPQLPAPSHFPAPPGATAAPATAPSALPPPPGLPAKLNVPPAAADDAPSPQGTKRQRDDSSDEEEQEDEDDDEGAMEMSDDED